MRRANTMISAALCVLATASSSSLAGRAGDAPLAPSRGAAQTQETTESPLARRDARRDADHDADHDSGHDVDHDSDLGDSQEDPGAGRRSVLLERYGPAAPDHASPRPQSERLRDAVARRAAIAAMKRLHAEGFGRASTTEARGRALDTIESLAGAAELEAGRAILGGAGDRIDLLATDPSVRAAFFRALGSDAAVGVPMLLDFAVTGDDPVRPQAIDALPRELPAAAEARVAEYLRGDRELYINRAAMIAASFGTAALIPSLVSAQFAPDTPRRGDEAWIVIGKQTTYVRDLIPTVGDGSAAFQPVPGTVFEGSLLRIMESAVTIYRTEVHYALSSLVERTTGEPAPPFGYDLAQWQRWESRELPRLLAERARHEREHEAGAETRTVPPARDID